MSTDDSPTTDTAPTPRRTAVIALGGNALSPPGERSSIHDQFRHTRESLGLLVELALDGWNLCLVHGNGPQVGDELVRNEMASAEVAPLPLGVLVAATAGWIGYMIQQSIQNALRQAGSGRSAVSIITQVKVGRDDPALAKQTGGEMKRRTAPVCLVFWPSRFRRMNSCVLAIICCWFSY